MANNANASRDKAPGGAKSRAPPPALNPESCALVQPYKDFVSRGFISKLAVEFTPLGVAVCAFLRSDLRKDGETSETRVSVGDAKQRIIDANLWTPRGKQGSGGNPKKDLLPKKSLCKEDFNGDNDSLFARATAVAGALGDTTARGRIGSLKMMIEGVDTFEDWWSGASASEKVRLLSDKKHHDLFSEGELTRVSALLTRSPFRGTVPSPSEEEEEPVSRSGSPVSKALVQKKQGTAFTKGPL